MYLVEYVVTQSQGSLNVSLHCIVTACVGLQHILEKPTVLAGHLKHTDTMPFK